MSHYHCEVIIPPTDDVVAAIEQVMQPFDENASADDSNGHGFWGYYVIGGRYAGSKLLQSIDQEKKAAFEQWLHDQKVTVSGIQFGKQTLQPAAQSAVVDAKWREMFPGTTERCPFFDHANDQRADGADGVLMGDIWPLGTSLGIKCHRIIFGGGHDGGADYMLTTREWNGVSIMPVAWDGLIGSALDMRLDELKNRSDVYRARATPDPATWLAVTVDYHS